MPFSLSGLTSFVSGLGGLATTVASFIPPRAPAAVGPAVVPAALAPAIIPRLAPLVRGMIGGIAAGVTIAELLRRSRESTGRSVSVKKIVEAARVCGLEVAAETFGLSVTEICTIIVSRRRRRRRGISATDLRRTRSTIRKITNMRRDFKKMIGAR